MPRTIFEHMGVGELRPTRMTLQLADSSVRLLLGIVEDVPIMVGKFFVPVDFVVMEIKEDKEIPIILGHPFFKIARTLIDVENKTLTLRIGDEKVEFNLNRAMKFPSETETCCAVDVVNQLAKEQSRKQYGSSLRDYPDYFSDLQVNKIAREKVLATEAKSDPLEDLTHGPNSSHTVRAPQSDKLEMAHEAHKAHTGAVHGLNSSHTDRATAQTEQPTPELKPFPANLRFLEDFKALQMVIWSTIMKAQ